MKLDTLVPGGSIGRIYKDRALEGSRQRCEKKGLMNSGAVVVAMKVGVLSLFEKCTT
jgi:hypothetical protein